MLLLKNLNYRYTETVTFKYVLENANTIIKKRNINNN